MDTKPDIVIMSRELMEDILCFYYDLNRLIVAKPGGHKGPPLQYLNEYFPDYIHRRRF